MEEEEQRDDAYFHYNSACLLFPANVSFGFGTRVRLGHCVEIDSIRKIARVHASDSHQMVCFPVGVKLKEIRQRTS